MKKIDCFIPFGLDGDLSVTIASLRESPIVADIYLLAAQPDAPASFMDCEVIQAAGGIVSTAAVKVAAARAKAPFCLIFTKFTSLSFVHYGLERMARIIEDTGAAMVYADHFKIIEGTQVQQPLIEYQEGSLRDDFDFGSLLLYRSDALKKAVAQMDREYLYAGLYDLRLKVSRLGQLLHIGEYCYYDIENDTRKSGQKQFDYVNPRNRAVQIEMEEACTDHLKAVGGYLEPVFEEISFDDDARFEASVVIPCRNRVRTVGDAIASALDQETTFDYNVIVVDDNSTDGSVDVIKGFLGNPRFRYIAQDQTYHAIGGNWNAALHHPDCGRFALQLDSDDLYSGKDTVQRFVDAFYAQRCAMVIGTYRITDFQKNTIPPGIIDHREWTPDNGRNNALRINGLGAPRGFYAPLLRELKFPTTKYGEDYAMGLRISRRYRIGRIYDEMYICRRWEGNSDADLNPQQVNANNRYKDSIRTWELMARKAMNRGGR